MLRERMPILSVAASAALLMLACRTFAASVCDGFNTPGQERQFANCQTILRRHLVPNRSALNYTLQYWLDNRDGLRDASCAVQGLERATACQSCRDEAWVREGFQNQCSFVINDLNRSWRRQPAWRRTTAYYIDLCATDPSKIVRSFYMNGGSGRRFDDSPDRDPAHNVVNTSTLAGAFKLEGAIYRQENSYNPRAYRGIMQRHQGAIPSIYMKGLNSSNNQTEADKPIHISPFDRGWGCPSVSEETGDSLFSDMVSRGSTLYMAYAGRRFEQHGDSCVNDHAGSSPRARRTPLTTRRGGSR